MSEKYRILAIIVIWAAIAVILIKGNALELAITGIGMVVPLALIIAGAICTNNIVNPKSSRDS